MQEQMKEGCARSALAQFEGRNVCCTGRFVNVRILDSGFMYMLFRGVLINGKYRYDHLWVECNRYFEGIGMKHGCTVRFYGRAKKYKNEDRYGISKCYNAEVLGYDEAAEDDIFADIRISLKTVNYNLDKCPGSFQEKGYQQFMHDYGLPLKTKCRMVYNPFKTFCNREGEIEFDMYGDGGRMAEFSKVSFNPDENSRRVSIDDRYYVKINETTHRQLMLLYFTVTSSGYGCMSYVPKEAGMDYMEVAGRYQKSYYYMNRLMFTVGMQAGPSERAGVM